MTVIPPYRLDLHDILCRGDAALVRAMSGGRKLLMAKDRVAATGQPDEKVYRLDSGWLCRSRYLANGRRQILVIHLPSELVGVKSLLYARQLDTIECLTDATINWIGQAELRALVTGQGDVALRVIWQIAEQERRLHNWTTGLGRCDAKQRMAAMLLDLRVRLQPLNLVNVDSYRLPMTRQDIADYLGLTVVHVSRVLPRFRRRGLATVENRLVTLHDMPALARLASPMLDWYERTAVEAALHQRFTPDRKMTGASQASRASSQTDRRD